MADEREPYERAPITEALIDLQVLLSADLRVEYLTAIKSRLTGDYGEPKEIFSDTLEWERAESGLTARTTRERLGFRFDRADGRRVLQARLNGFTFSALAPYDRWSKFRSEARELWDAYKAVARPKTVTRVAVRYINRVDIPLPSDDQAEPLMMEAYFTTYPEITGRLQHSAFSRFIMQVEIPQPDIQSTLLLNEAVVDPPSPEVVSVVLDLDLFRLGEWDAQNDEPIWQFLDILRDRKNEAFEGSITDKARRLFR